MAPPLLGWLMFTRLRALHGSRTALQSAHLLSLAIRQKTISIIWPTCSRSVAIGAKLWRWVLALLGWLAANLFELRGAQPLAQWPLAAASAAMAVLHPCHGLRPQTIRFGFGEQFGGARHPQREPQP